ncbi:dynein regulatory complex subunit [Trifolium repens]|nr:dynein regulatory complex subunit [Trifolium repens]
MMESSSEGLQKLTTLNVEGCNITAACFEYISALTTLACLNLNRCGLSDDGFEKFSGLTSLRRLRLAFNKITDACLVHLKAIVSFGNIFATQKTEAEEFGTTCFFWGEFL